MGKHEAPQRATRPKIVTRHVATTLLHHGSHFIIICAHTTLAVVLIEKTPLLVIVGLMH